MKTMNTNHLTTEQIAYVSEMQLSGRYSLVSEEIKQHLQQCDSCAAEVLDVNELSILISRQETKKRNVKLWGAISIAASLLIIATISFLPQQIEQNPHPANKSQDIATVENHDTTENIAQNSIVEKKVDKNAVNQNRIEVKNASAKKRVHDKYTTKKTNSTSDKSIDLMAQYVPDDHLESLVERAQNGHMRSSDMVSGAFNINYPEQKTIRLINNQGKEILIEIYTNKGRLVKDETCTDSLYSIPKLENGLYYYKLISPDFDLLMVGRITVK